METLRHPVKSLISSATANARGYVESDEFKRALEIGSYKTTFQRYGAIFIPMIVLTIMGLMFLTYRYNRGTTVDEQKAADGIFTGIMSTLGIAFALSGIYSMPYITSSTMANAVESWGKAMLYYNTGIAPKHFTFSDGSQSDKCGRVLKTGDGAFADPYVDHCGKK